MSSAAEYEPSPRQWVRDQVEAIESSGGTDGLIFDGAPVVVLYTVGAKTGKLRKVPLMRVEHDGRYAIIASRGGSPINPVWYHNVKADPHVQLRDGTVKGNFVARQVFGDEQETWWQRAIAAYPVYADYRAKTDRQIPVFVLEPSS